VGQRSLQGPRLGCVCPGRAGVNRRAPPPTVRASLSGPRSCHGTGDNVTAKLMRAARPGILLGPSQAWKSAVQWWRSTIGRVRPLLAGLNGAGSLCLEAGFQAAVGAGVSQLKGSEWSDHCVCCR